ncbi:MAG: hypothetical protein EOP54_09885 [Sphingobacteriales bacterium]|nr:MAG: hypothetical protein EOP54_09885 [Sphingobacteriales bacterium]
MIQCAVLPAMGQGRDIGPVFPTDSLAIEQAVHTLIQKKIVKSQRYYRKLEATNVLFLKKLKQQEVRIIAKLRTDSLKYQQYLALKSPDMDSLLRQSKDATFINKLNTAGSRGRSVLDTLQGLQGFMGKYSDNSFGAAFDLPDLQKKAALQQYLQQQVAARTGALERLLKGTQLERYSSRLNNTGLQYKEQAGYWKRMLDEPDAAEEKALDYLRGIDGFEAQLNPGKGNSLAGKPAAELEAMGYQTKAKVGEQLQQQFGDQLGNISQRAGEQLKQYTAALDKPLQQVKQAKQTINESKQKLEAGRNAMQAAKHSLKRPAGFKNPMRGIPFWQRWETQYNFQTQKASADGTKPVMLQTGLNLSYRQSKALSIGVGLDGSIGLGRNWQHLRLSYEGVIGRVFLDHQLVWGISLQGGYEKSLRPMNRAYTQLLEQYGHPANVKTAMGLLQDAAYLGIMKRYKINSKLQGTMLVGYNFLNDKTKISSPWIIRLGWKL